MKKSTNAVSKGYNRVVEECEKSDAFAWAFSIIGVLLMIIIALL